jgi:ubiquinone/menaquinone biosynthesis C-methylase UbiE
MSASLKNILLKIYSWPLVSTEKANQHQKKIRDTEWEAIQKYIQIGKFIDIGSGAGYALKKAAELGNTIYGIDPNPGEHGVGRTGSGFHIADVNIIQASAENIPFDDKIFDTVYSSHVLEHVEDANLSLSEIKRILKDEGVLIIGMPTASMAFINLTTNTLFTIHQRLINFFLSPFIKTGKTTFRQLFVPNSHSHANKTVFFDLKYYRVKNWKKIISKHFQIQKIIKPALYPYPEKIQFFPIHRNRFYSSSVFFICKK